MLFKPVILVLFEKELISNFVSIYSDLRANKITQLPENVFSGLTRLSQL